MASEYGSAVVNGEVKHFSASSLTAGDPTQDGGCERRYWFKYVLHKPEPPKGFNLRGTAMHEDLEQWQKTGVDALGTLARVIKPFMLSPSPLTQTEVQVSTRVAGVRVVGKIDVRHALGEYVDPFGERRREEVPTVEVIDHKSTSDPRWIKPAAIMAATVQMTVYGRDTFENYQGIERVRLSHNYAVDRKPPTGEKVTAIRTREQIDRQWDRVEAVARNLIDIAKETDETKVPANRNACDSYGGCPHAEYCQAFNQPKTIFERFGKASAMSILGLLQNNTAPATTTAQPAPPFAGFPAPAPGVPVPGVVVPAPGVPAQAIANLLAEEQATIAAQAPAPSPAVPPGFAEAVKALDAAGLGWPMVTGAACALVSAVRGWGTNPGAIAGSGRLAEAPAVSTADALIALASQAAAFAAKEAKPAPVAGGLLPPDAPASNPALASKPAEAPAMPTADASTDAPKKRGRPAKPKPEAAPPAQYAGTPVPLEPAPVSAPSAPAQVVTVVADAPPRATAGLVIMVNCVPTGTPYESLAPYADTLNETLARHFHCEPADVRCAPKDCAALAFGAWRGAIAAFAKASPPPAGVYVAHTRGNEILEVIADALRGSCAMHVVGTGG